MATQAANLRVGVCTVWLRASVLALLAGLMRPGALDVFDGRGDAQGKRLYGH